jgi:hypothetical protein
MSNRGRPRTSSRIFEQNYAAIDMADLKKMPGFKPNISYDFLPDVPDPILKLSVTCGWADGTNTTVRLQTTSPHFGGRRYWFVCPNCSRIMRKLYPHTASHSMACRKCLGLVYNSQYRKGSKYALFRLIRNFMKNLATLERLSGVKISRNSTA